MQSFLRVVSSEHMHNRYVDRVWAIYVYIIFVYSLQVNWAAALHYGNF